MKMSFPRGEISVITSYSIHYTKLYEVKLAVAEIVSQVSETVNVTVTVPPSQRSGGVVPANVVSRNNFV